MTEIHVDIVSDVMCPWCYVGKRRFEKALESVNAEIEVHLHWRPFQLDPTLPPGGKDREAYLAEKFGGIDRAKELYRNIEQAGDGEHDSGGDCLFAAFLVCVHFANSS